MDEKQEKERRARLRAIRREIATLCDEANLVADDLPAEERRWIESIFNLLEALDARDALKQKEGKSSD